ncbi:MAG TPA: hypothetical protein VEZ71_18395 [Archangium sp.]|nr:hypothetical protein [Archangium sp.]
MSSPPPPVSEPLSSRAVIRFLFQSSRRGVAGAALLGGLSGASSTALLALIQVLDYGQLTEVRGGQESMARAAGATHG